MGSKGQVIDGTGSSIEFVDTTAESDGERLSVEITYEPATGKPPTHFHPSQTERFEVLEGEIHAIVGGTKHVLGPGDTLDVPAGTAHEMWSPKGGRQRWTTSPALRTERFFETVWGLQADGKTGDDGMPSKLQMALTVRHFADEFRLVDPPAAVQAVVFPALAAVARLRGLEPEYQPSS